ncbi:hypothetical protein SynBIOSE41_03094 [Synechococcus sp. BIOS-E4-1]|nr:hypothetical protein SynBIOSE41_03094 [Synechococcus sp. BIOS-E4-1]
MNGSNTQYPESKNGNKTTMQAFNFSPTHPKSNHRVKINI